MNSTKLRFVIAAGLGLAASVANAQQLRDNYVDKGGGSDKIAEMISTWSRGNKVTADDNFYISRVKPKARFRNAATQVRQNLNEANDKKLLAWVPVGTSDFNALPNGVFDSEVFSMWPYVTHWGNWTAAVGRIPAAFLDAAHKNGVPVSGVASIPNAPISSSWLNALTALANSDVDQSAKFFRYFGIDGIGYNSEFSGGGSMLGSLRAYHAALVKKMRQDNPAFENIWYDGTNDFGRITFDQGLGDHNKQTFGDGENVRTSLFLNYNWNNTSRMDASIAKANELGRSPLDLYCGFNMQGAEPKLGTRWPLLVDRNLSIGLWGAHESNMWWESRGEKGSDPAVKQNTYLQRIERWFTGGTRNPASCPEVSNSMTYVADNFDFFGMSTFMTARSAMAWNLDDEPFITYFNLGNGKFFNYNGVQQNDRPWYNIGMQDYLPTWRWWFASQLLGRTAADVPSNGLEANFTWDDAYFGGSTVRITGSTSSEYLHLFKTQFGLKSGDVVTFKYKVKGGTADIDLVLSAKGSETEGKAYGLLTQSQETDEDQWVAKTFAVGSDFNAKDLALVALHFQNADNLDLLLGEFSIVRGTASAPAAPELESAQMLYNSKSGMDAKIIFNMPNDKAEGEPCYNTDVKTAFFKLYAQAQGGQPVLMGTTTSWAGLYFSIPVQSDPNAQVRLGVSAVSLDHKAESPITWSGYMSPANYVYNDDVLVDKTTIKPNEKFTLYYSDPNHEDGTWQLYDTNGEKVFEGSGNSVAVEGGLAEIGSYDLKITGNEYDANGNRTSTTRTMAGFVQITGEGVGALPEIYTLTANGQEADITVNANQNVAMAYTGRHADGAGSQGVELAEKRFGTKCADLGIVGGKSFSTAFWLKINSLAAGETQLLSVANKLDSWPKTDWGWIWSNVKDDGTIGSFTFRGTDATSNKELQYTYGKTKLPVGSWVHIAYTFDYDAQGKFRANFYVNGIKQEITAWNRSNETARQGEPGYEADVYKITGGQVLAVGGDAHGRNGIDGVIDNFQVWNKVLTDAEVKASMGDINTAALPDGLAAYWSLEEKAASDYTFPSVGSLTGVKAGLHTYAAEGGEGQGRFGWLEPSYTSGCPFVTGTAFKVETLPTWKAKKATVSNASGNSEAGQATLSYAKDGDYSVTLTLANSLGSDERTFQVIKVGKGSGIEETQGQALKAYATAGTAFVQFAEEGRYEVGVYTTAGQRIASKAATVAAGGNVKVSLGKPGVYLLSVKKDGKAVRTVKLVVE